MVSMIIAFGELLVDMIKRGASYTPFPGGAPANFAVGVSRLGLKSKIIACVGKEPFGDFLVDCVRREGVDAGSIKRTDKQTTLAFVELKENGSPEFFFYRGADIELSANDISPGVLSGASHMHFGGLSLTTLPIRDALFTCLASAKSLGLTTSFSPNLRKDLWSKSFDPHLKKALNQVDILISSKEEFKHISGGQDTAAEARALMEKHGIKTVAVTMGAKGAIMVTPDQSITSPAFKVQTVDTTGSGDAFAAAMIYGMNTGMEGETLLRFAGAAAAISTTKFGAMSALPNKKEVDDFLAAGPKIVI